MSHQLDQYYLDKAEPNRSCLLALRSIIRAMDDEVTETLKYGAPCFSYRGKMFCYLWVEKKSNLPYLLMVEGKHLNHPLLEAGDRKRMKIFRVNPNRDIPIDTIQLILRQALDLYREGIIEI